MPAAQDPKNIKILAIDLDGTLLRGDKTVSGYTLDVLRRCMASGIKIVFATARPARAVRLFLGELPCDGLICHNGAVMFAGGTRLLRSAAIPFPRAEALLKYWARAYPDSRICAEFNDRLYTNFDVGLYWKYTESTITDFTGLPKLPAEKVIIQVRTPAEADELSALFGDDLYGFVGDGDLMFIMHRDAKKSTAVGAMAAHFGLDISQVAAFGDDTNDIDMLAACGIGVAMANATAAAKAAADVVALSNREDGVARFVEERLL